MFIFELLVAILLFFIVALLFMVYQRQGDTIEACEKIADLFVVHFDDAYIRKLLKKLRATGNLYDRGL